MLYCKRFLTGFIVGIALPMLSYESFAADTRHPECVASLLGENSPWGRDHPAPPRIRLLGAAPAYSLVEIDGVTYQLLNNAWFLGADVPPLLNADGTVATLPHVCNFEITAVANTSERLSFFRNIDSQIVESNMPDLVIRSISLDGRFIAVVDTSMVTHRFVYNPMSKRVEAVRGATSFPVQSPTE